MSSDTVMVRWQVTITCPRPPRVPGYEADTWHLAPERTIPYIKNVMTAEQTEVTFTPQRVRLSYVLEFKLDPRLLQRSHQGRVEATVHGAGRGARALAHMLDGCCFEMHGNPPELPAPVRIELRELEA